MKRSTFFVLFALFALVTGTLLPVFSANAQDGSGLITLNDATPAVDVVISLPADTTGTVSLSFTQVAIRLVDGNGNVVFSAANPHLHALEMNLVPNSGTHTLTIERLPGVALSTVKIITLPEMTMNGAPVLTEARTLTVNQETGFALTEANPVTMVNVDIPKPATGVMTATFPGAFVSSQLVAIDGAILAQSVGGHVDGLTFLLDAGSYNFTMLGTKFTGDIRAGVRVMPTDQSGFVVLVPPVPPTQAPAAAAKTGTCTALISAASVNLRSGPGTGYTVLGYGYRDEKYTVGGRNPENNWALVGAKGGSAWVSLSGITLQGGCASLKVYNIPLKDATAPEVIISTQAPTDNNNSNNNTGDDHDDDNDDGEDDHDDEDEHKSETPEPKKTEKPEKPEKPEDKDDD